MKTASLNLQDSIAIVIYMQFSFEKRLVEPGKDSFKKDTYLHQLENLEDTIRRSLEGGYLEGNMERLDIQENLGLLIHDFYYQFAISEEEAKDLMERLSRSKGRDNETTLSIISFLKSRTL